MRIAAIGLCLVFVLSNAHGQSDNTAEQVIQGSKVVIELIKVLINKKEVDKNPGCKNAYADICIVNESSATATAVLYHRSSGEKREMVIQPKSKECSLRIHIGVWTYDLRMADNLQSIRKGDLLIEACQNLNMNVKY